jgi:hypothetical protein
MLLLHLNLKSQKCNNFYVKDWLREQHAGEHQRKHCGELYSYVSASYRYLISLRDSLEEGR